MRGRKVEKSRLSFFIVGHMYMYEREGGREVSFVTYIVGYIYIYERAEGREVSFVMCVRRERDRDLGGGRGNASYVSSYIYM